MKIKKYIGSFALFLATIVIRSSSASTLLVGVEEMPESIKKVR